MTRGTVLGTQWGTSLGMLLGTPLGMSPGTPLGTSLGASLVCITGTSRSIGRKKRRIFYDTTTTPKTIVFIINFSSLSWNNRHNKNRSFVVAVCTVGGCGLLQQQQ